MNIEDIRSYIKGKGYKFCTITDILSDHKDITTAFAKYIKKAIANPTFVLHFQRNKQTARFFQIYSNDVDLYFMNKDNFVTLRSTTKFGDGEKKLLDTFLEDAAKCLRCGSTEMLGFTCEKCAGIVCTECHLKYMDDQSGIYKCSRCSTFLKR